MQNGYQNQSGAPGASAACKIILIAGFLGSGKTTLLKRFIQHEAGHGICSNIIMSEFGDLDIDGALLGKNGIKLSTITGGCACCDLRDELAGAVSSFVDASPGSTIFIESTGVGDPAGIIESIAPLIDNRAVVIGNVIVVYDASRRLLPGKDGELARRQLGTADTIIINKSDLTSPAEVEDAIASIKVINPTAELIATSQCRIDIEKALARRSNIEPVAGVRPTSETFRSFGFSIEAPLSRKPLEKWLASLPPSVLRAKGFVEIDGQEGLFEVQAARGQVSVTRLTSGEKPDAMLVLVAHPMRSDGLVKGLQRCVA